jgi:hypothetical protein
MLVPSPDDFFQLGVRRLRSAVVGLLQIRFACMARPQESNERI